MMKDAIFTLLLTALLALPASGQAETAKNHFRVQLTLVPTCSVDIANRLASENPPTGTMADVSKEPGGELEVACSKGTSYDIGLSGKNEIRTIRSAQGSTAGYELFWEKDNNLDWENTPVFSATGTGKTTAHRVIRRGNSTLSLDGKTTTGVVMADEITITLTF